MAEVDGQAVGYASFELDPLLEDAGCTLSSNERTSRRDAGADTSRQRPTKEPAGTPSLG